MADLKKVMEKLNSQKSEKAPVQEKKVLPKMPVKVPPKPKVAPPAPEVEEEYEEVEEYVEEPQEEAPEQQLTQDRRSIQEEIESLQNNGIFRAALIYQLVQVNESLSKIVEFIEKSGGDSNE